MAFSVSPTVTISEFDQTTVVPAISTTEAAIAGQFRWGPLNERVLVTNEDELVRRFWKPNTVVANVWFSAANFLQYGNQLYVVRVASESNANSQLVAKNSTVSNSNGFLVKNDEHYENSYSNGVLNTTHTTGAWIGKYPGSLGNSLRVSVCSFANTFESTLTGSVSVTANSATVTGSGTDFATEASVGDIFIINSEQHIVQTVTNATSITLRTRHSAGASGNTVTRRWEFYNYVDTAPGTSDYVSNLGGSDDEMHIVIADEDGEFTGTANTVLEVYQKVSKASDAITDSGLTNYYKNVINQRSAYVRWAGHESALTSAGSTAKNTNFGGQDLVINRSLSAGTDGGAVSDSDRIRGYNLFRSPEDVDVSIIIGADANQTVSNHILNNVVGSTTGRMDAIAVLSPPRASVVNNADSEATSIITHRNTLPSTSYGVLDSGWKWQYDRYNDVNRYVPLNGDTAGTIVATDIVRDPWWSPAGYNRGNIKGVIKLAYNPRKADRDLLYKSGINPVVTFDGQGTVLFGDKTLLSKPSAFDRINVRRLFIVLEKAISTAAKFTLFEFNDEFTRANFKALVEPFLRNIQGRRGIQEFLVVCDETNNTPEVIDRNEFVGDIYIKPARSINFIQLNFVAVASSVDFTEKVLGRSI